jgi:hypothetical protein
MRELPSGDSREDFAVLVVRTDYSDDLAWQAVVDELMRPWGSLQQEADVQFVNDPEWSGADVSELLAAAAGDEYLSVVFLVDGITIREGQRTLLAVNVPCEDEWGDDEESQEWAALGRPFRITPQEVHGLHVDRALGNMDFEEYAEVAQQAPDGIFRGFS